MIAVIVLILYLTHKSWIDALLMMTSVLGALAGGAIFQWLFGFNFSVAVQVGYIACFGMAVETGVVMLVYLREAIDERGGLERIGSIAELRQAILEGAVHRLRPKLLTEGAAIISIAPMLWATGRRRRGDPADGRAGARRPADRRRGDRRLPARPLLRRPESGGGGSSTASGCSTGAGGSKSHGPTRSRPCEPPSRGRPGGDRGARRPEPSRGSKPRIRPRLPGDDVMRPTLRTTIVAGVLAVCGLLATTRLAHAGGCCGGGGGGARYSAARTYSAPNTRAACCNMTGMNMAGMPMASMQMPATSMQGMDMTGAPVPIPAPAATSTKAPQPAAPAAAASQYFCPMHPKVVASGPATCPYCRMALKKR